MMRQPTGGGIYRIRIGGALDPAWSEWFEGMECAAEERPDQGPTTLLTGFVLDQATLHGIIDRIGALGLVIVSIEQDLPT